MKEDVMCMVFIDKKYINNCFLVLNTSLKWVNVDKK